MSAFNICSMMPEGYRDFDSALAAKIELERKSRESGSKTQKLYHVELEFCDEFLPPTGGPIQTTVPVSRDSVFVIREGIVDGCTTYAGYSGPTAELEARDCAASLAALTGTPFSAIRAEKRSRFDKRFKVIPATK
ncbi:MAG: hypothetical protein V2A66_09250 [Pseudomonadota bacterium]